jgi:hypothetical protein
MSQAKPPFKASPPPLRKLRRRIFHVLRGNVRVTGAEQLTMATRQLEGGGQGDLRIDAIL